MATIPISDDNSAHHRQLADTLAAGVRQLESAGRRLASLLEVGRRLADQDDSLDMSRADAWLHLAGQLGAQVLSAADEQILSELVSQTTGADERDRPGAAIESDVTARRLVERRQAMLVAVTRILAESDTRYEAIPLLLETIGISAGCDLAELWRVDSQANLLRWENDWHVSGLNAAEFEIVSCAITIPPGVGMCGRVWASARPEWVERVAAGPTFLRASVTLEIGLRAAFAFPIRGAAGVLGVIVCFCRDTRPPDIPLMMLLADIGSQIGQFFDRKHAEEQLWQYTQRLRTQRALDQAILALQAPEAIAQAALRHIRELIPCRHASVAALDLAAGELVIWAVDVSGPTGVSSGMRYPLPNGPPIDILQRGEPYIVEDVGKLPHEDPVALAARKEGAGSILSVPLIAQAQLIGTLNLAADRPAAFTPETVSIACEVGDQLAIAIQNARLFEQVRVGRERLQHLSRQLVRAQEDERRRLAHELHDEIGQSLTAVQLNIQTLLSLRDPRALSMRLEDSMVLIEGLLEQVRALSLDLRPSILDDLGLVPALRWCLKRQAERAGFSARFLADLPEDQRFSAELETACFRVAQEALTNVARHAQARQVVIELRQSNPDEMGGDGELQLLIHDDGVGFDVGAARGRAARGASLGLLGMQERTLLIGGRITIESAPGRGAFVHAHFPLPGPLGRHMPLERRKEPR